MTHEIYIYDEIGPSEWGLYDDKWLISELAEIPDKDELTVRINSPGGMAFAGISMHNALRRRSGKTIAAVDALAGSAATIVALGADEVQIAKNADWVIHNAWALAIGDHNEMYRQADILKKLSGQMADLYQERTEQDLADVVSQMDAETWFTGEEAVAAGYADSLSASLDVAIPWADDLPFRHVPDRVAARVSVFQRRVGAKADRKYRQDRQTHVNRLITEMQVARRRSGV